MQAATSWLRLECRQGDRLEVAPRKRQQVHELVAGVDFGLPGNDGHHRHALLDRSGGVETPVDNAVCGFRSNASIAIMASLTDGESFPSENSGFAALVSNLTSEVASCS
jgi:hypothetical protein